MRRKQRAMVRRFGKYDYCPRTEAERQELRNFIVEAVDVPEEEDQRYAAIETKRQPRLALSLDKGRVVELPSPERLQHLLDLLESLDEGKPKEHMLVYAFDKDQERGEQNKIPVERIIGVPNRRVLIELWEIILEQYAEEKARKAREEREGRVQCGEAARGKKADALAELWEPKPKRRARREKE